MADATKNAAILHGRNEEFAKLQNNGSDLPWYKNKGLLQLNACLSAVFVAQALNGYDGSLVSGFQALTPWREALDYPSSSAIGLLNAAVYLAGLVTSPFAAYAADRFGRRWCILYMSITNLIGTVLGCAAGTGSSSGYGMFIVSRIFCGSGVLPHPKQRTKFAGFFDVSFIMGQFLAGWIIFGTSGIKSNWSWRIPYIIHIPFATFMLFAVLVVPESPRWLMSKGRHEEARDFLLKYHANGATSDELVDFQMQEIQDQLDYEATHKGATWGVVFGTKGNRHRIACVVLIACCQNLSGTAIISYYYTSILKLVGITKTAQTTGINAGLTTWTFFVAVFALWLTQRINRRPQLAISWIGTLCANIGLIVSSAHYAKHKDASSGIAAVFFVWMYNASFFIACGPLFFSYQAEILTYSIRAKGMMIWQMTVKCLSVFNAYANSVALAKIGWKYYLVYTGTLTVTGIAMYFLIVETRGYTLEEIAVLFDGEDSAFANMDDVHPSDKKTGSTGFVKEADEESA
ncbi:general substrate transporter [Pseudohyphozyma bogoriensis]|nr:general substrate transporter [Pseudohyphozyma bogoriensis]